MRQRGSEEGLSWPWECSWDGPVQSAGLGLESTAIKPATRPGRAHLPTRGQRPADAQLRRCWTSVVSGQRTERLVQRTGQRNPPPRRGRRGAGREEPGLSQLSVQSIQELVGEFIHKEPGPGHTRPFRAPAPRRLSILCLCIRPPGCLSPPTACSVSGRVTGQMFFVSSPRAVELGISNH